MIAPVGWCRDKLRLSGKTVVSTFFMLTLNKLVTLRCRLEAMLLSFRGDDKKEKQQFVQK